MDTPIRIGKVEVEEKGEVSWGGASVSAQGMAMV